MSKLILVVDDQEVDRAALQTILQAEPTWRIVHARSGQEALDLLCSGQLPQLCLVDLQMPNIGGLEFLQRIRRDRQLRTLRVMVISGRRDRETILELARLGIDGYVLKPFDADRLLATLRPVLNALPDLDEQPAVLRDLLAKTALIADDDAVAREALAALVKTERHWGVVEVADGASALAQLRGGLRPHLCFIDLQMPGMDGLALLGAIRADPELQSLRAVVTTATRDRDKIVTLAQLRIEGYLLKPVEAAKVCTLLRSVA